MSTKTFTAIIADDEALLRDELSDILTELWTECEIVAEAADGFQALELTMLNRAQTGHLKFIQASVGKQVRFIMVQENLYLQSDNKYTNLVTANGKAFIRTSITELEADLNPDQFWRVHRFTIVNIRAVDNVVREEGEKMTVRLRGKVEKLEVSGAHQTQFKWM